jgi:lipid-A-disaccharide synthase
VTECDRSVPARRPLKLFISTGEVSGDLQGALLIEALHRQAQALGMTLDITVLGGQRMGAAGATVVCDTTAIGAVGIFEALPYLIPTLRAQRLAQQHIQANPPDLVVYIDYMNPNLVLGKFLRQHFPQVPTVYYIAPQQWVWAFSKKDSEALVGISDQMLAIFPQEADYFRQFGAAVTWVGHPLLDRFAHPPDRTTARSHFGLSDTDTVVALLPASRRQEITYILPIMLAAARIIHDQMPQVKFLVPVSREELRPLIEKAIAKTSLPIQMVEGATQRAIAAADLAITKSGTVNLETALMQVPQVVIYRLNPITARLGYYLLRLRIPFVSPVNLVLGEAVVPEFIQWEADPAAIAQAAVTLLQDATARATMLAGYDRMRQSLGEPGACDRAAAALLAQGLKKVAPVPTPEA